MKPFNLEEAKQGKPVCTRSGRKARIICFDARNDQPIVALIEDADNRYEITYNYDSHGKWDEGEETAHDLMMVEEIETLPNSWEEFCQNYPIENDEYYLSEDAIISNRFDGYRDVEVDKILFRTKEQAEAMLAFIQLIRLRDVYRQGWEPNWTKEEKRYGVGCYEDVIVKDISYHASLPLSFQSEEIRDKFLENFRDLIEKAKEFI